MAEQRIQLAEAQAKAIATQDGPQIDFSADMERQKMSAEGLMGPFALNDPAAGTTGPWYTNGTFGLTAGWHLDAVSTCAAGVCWLNAWRVSCIGAHPASISNSGKQAMAG